MILDQFGRPYNAPRKPERHPLAAAPLYDAWREYVAAGLTPGRLASIFKEADAGNMLRQAELFEQIEEKDAHLLGEMSKRRNAILDYELKVAPASDDPRDHKIAEFVDQWIKGLSDIEDILVSMQESVGKGYAAFEIDWDVSEGQAIPQGFEFLPHKRFSFIDPRGIVRRTPLLLTDRSPMGEEIPAWKVMFHCYGGKSGHPTRSGIYRVCCWMFLFKNYSLKDWVTFCEVYGMPLRLGRYDPGASQEDRDALVQAISSLGTDAAGVISKSTEIEFIEGIKGAASGTVYENLVAFCNHEISKAILGQTLSAEVGERGSYAASKTHNEVRKDLERADARAVAATFRNQVIRPVVGFNFGWDAPVPGFRLYQEASEDLNKKAERLEKLVRMGVPVPVSYARKEFAIPEPDKGEEILSAYLPQIARLSPKDNPIVASDNKMQPRASGEPGDPSRYLAQLEESADPHLSAMIGRVKSLAFGATTLPHLRDALLDLYPLLDIDGLAMLLAKAMAVSDLAGRSDVLEEGRVAARLEPVGLAFDEAIEFFRQKINIPTARWNDLWQGMHARGFMVAGAMKEDLLCDFRTAIDKAISQGTTLAEFQKDFDQAVARHGWNYNGSREWRTRVIFETNLMQAYNTGRYQQMDDPEVRASRPYLQYRHGDSMNPRPEHLAWHGLVLPADDPWWDTHRPQNGWGCKCSVFALSEQDLGRLGKSGPDTAPEQRFYTWTDRVTGITRQVPEGIDPGFDYDPGRVSQGRRLSQEAMEAWRVLGGAAWEQLGGGDWRSAGRPERIPVDVTGTSLGKRCATAAEAAGELERILGGQEKTFTLSGLHNAVLVNARSLADHIDLSRSAFLTYLPETLEAPFEVWMAFERHRGTGKVELRTRFIKAVQAGTEKEKGMLVVAQAKGGVLEAWTMIPVSNLKYLGKQRRGTLVWKR